jgi:AcrR family transcriptional regulator
MARPFSEQKRSAILDAAVKAIASNGTEAATAKIARAAGVAEGTFFVYFPTKDNLLNRLYLNIKVEVRDAVLADYPVQASTKQQFEHLWNRLIEWRERHPDRQRVIRRLEVSERITGESREAGWRALSDILTMIDRGIAERVLRNIPVTFLARIMETMADLVFERIADDPGSKAEYKHLGWEAFWGAISH